MCIKLKSALISSALIFVFLTCTTDESQSPAELSHLRTDYGGCNEEGVGKLLPKLSYDSDTLYWEISGDTLKIFTGINYICEAPFVSESWLTDDSITIIIRDTCNFDVKPCYAYCYCYYEFLTMFTGYTDDQYHLSVYLHDPRQAQDFLLWKVEIP